MGQECSAMREPTLPSGPPRAGGGALSVDMTHAGYLSLPELGRGEGVRCPECSSADVDWGGDFYDCLSCWSFFPDYAADPPHRRADFD